MFSSAIEFLSGKDYPVKDFAFDGIPIWNILGAILGKQEQHLCEIIVEDTALLTRMYRTEYNTNKPTPTIQSDRAIIRKKVSNKPPEDTPARRTRSRLAATTDNRSLDQNPNEKENDTNKKGKAKRVTERP